MSGTESGSTPQAEFLRALAGGRSWKKALEATGLADDEAIAVLNQAADELDGSPARKPARRRKKASASEPPLPPPPTKSPFGSAETAVVHADGASRGNPGPASYGCVYLDGDGRPAFGEAAAIGRATNNVAEYRGCLAALHRLAGWKVRRAVVRLDSQLVVRQLEGRYRVKDATLRGWYAKVVEQARDFERIDFEYVPRAENSDADRMANWALDVQKS